MIRFFCMKMFCPDVNYVQFGIVIFRQFHQRFFCALFLYERPFWQLFQLRFSLMPKFVRKTHTKHVDEIDPFWQNNIAAKAACKMLMKLSGLNAIYFFFVNAQFFFIFVINLVHLMINALFTYVTNTQAKKSKIRKR